MRLMPRDRQLLRWMNANGFVTINHIMARLGIAQTTAYIRMKKLVDASYCKHDAYFVGEPGLYRVSEKGVHVSGSALPPLKSIAQGSYYHDLIVTTLSLKLMTHYQAQFIPERVLRHDDNQEVFGKTGHTADGVLLHDNKRIAIEVELSKKSKRRLSSIIHHYMKCFEMKEVWYFCGNSEVKRLVESHTKDKGFFRLFDLRDYVTPDDVKVRNGK